MIDHFLLLCFGMLVLTGSIFTIGKQLALYAEQLVQVTGISGGIVGFVLIAIITSTPEMVSTFLSASKGFYGLTIGGVLGSNIANIGLFSAICLFFHKQQLVISKTSLFSVLSSLFLLSIVGILISIYPISHITLSKYPPIIAIIMIYFYIIYYVYRLSSVEIKNIKDSSIIKYSLHVIIFFFLLYTILIILCSWGLVILCNKISVVPVPIYNKTLGEHFVGTLILALATSIPEVATTVQIIKIGETDMAVGNIAGSNVLNLLVLALSGFFVKGDFWHMFPINSLYTVLLIFSVSVLICLIALLPSSEKISIKIIHMSVIIIWIGSLFLVFT